MKGNSNDPIILEMSLIPFLFINIIFLIAFQELIKYSSRLGDETADLQRALELMQTLPQRATDTKFISSIEGFKGNLFKLGRLLRHVSYIYLETTV